MVVADVEAGWISKDKAKQVYGVVLTPDDATDGGVTVNANETTALRAKLASEFRPRGHGPGEVHPLGEMLRVPETALVAE